MTGYSVVVTGGGRTGLSAYEVYVEVETAAGRTPLSKEDWVLTLPWTLDPTSWNALSTYTERTAVQHNGSLWLALKPSIGITPGTDATAWVLLLTGVDTDLFDALLVQAEAEATAAQTARAAAEAAAASAAAEAPTFADTAAGLAGTSDGDYFRVIEAGSDYVSIYLNDGGAAVAQASLPARPVTDGLISDLATEAAERKSLIIGPARGNGWLWAVTDPDGFVLGGVRDDYTIVFGTTEIGTLGMLTQVVDITAEAGDGLRVLDPDGFLAALISGGRVASGETSIDAAGLVTSDFALRPSGDGAFRLVDPDGFIGLSASGDGLKVAKVVNSDGTEALALATRNAANLARSAAVARALNTTAQRPTATITQMLWYGQSLSVGAEAWPKLTGSIDTGLGLRMIGQSTRPDARTSAGFTPLGNSDLNDLAAVVQSSDLSTILDDPTVAALDPGTVVYGEGPDIAAALTLRALQLAHLGREEETDRLLLITSCGVGGQSIEDLSPGADPDLYQRVPDAVTLGKAKADGLSGSFAIGAISHMQGESGSADKATHKAGTVAVMQAIFDDCADAIAGQAKRPAVFTYQTQGNNMSKETQALYTPLGQIELIDEQPDWYVVGPSYPYSDKGTHFDPNGSRWMGCQFGKVHHRVLVLGQDWRPLMPTRLTHEAGSRDILIDFHVPEPPLVFDTPLIGTDFLDLATKGFRVLEDASEVEIAAVEIVADTVLRLRLDAVPTGALEVHYATKTAAGADPAIDGFGCLRDSDPTLAPLNYVYASGTGQYAAADIASLKDKPYPLHNWGVSFIKPVEEF